MAVGRVRVSDQTQMSDDPPQPGRIQPTGRLHQHRLGRHRHLLGQLLGAMGQHPSMPNRELPTDQRRSRGRQRTTKQGPGRADTAGRGPSTQPQPGPQPGRGRANLLALVSPASPPGVDSSQLPEPEALQPVHQPPQDQDPFGPGSVREAVQSWVASPSTAAANTASSSSRPPGS